MHFVKLPPHPPSPTHTHTFILTSLYLCLHNTKMNITRVPIKNVSVFPDIIVLPYKIPHQTLVPQSQSCRQRKTRTFYFFVFAKLKCFTECPAWEPSPLIAQGNCKMCAFEINPFFLFLNKTIIIIY